MTAAISVVRLVRIAAIAPPFAEGLLAVEEHELDCDFRFLRQTAEDASDLEQCSDGGCRIVGAHEVHVLVILGVVVTADQDGRLSFTGKLAGDVCHLLFALRCLGRELIDGDGQTERLQLLDNVSARLFECWTSRRAWSNFDLLTCVAQRAFPVECCWDWWELRCGRRACFHADAWLARRFLVLWTSREEQWHNDKQKHTARTSESVSAPGLIARLAVGHLWCLLFLCARFTQDRIHCLGAESKRFLNCRVESF